MSEEQNQINNEAQKQQEQCPFCKFPIADGASVCIGCGARRETARDRFFPMYGIMFIPLVFICIGFANSVESGTSFFLTFFLIFAGITGFLWYLASVASENRWRRKD